MTADRIVKVALTEGACLSLYLRLMSMAYDDVSPHQNYPRITMLVIVTHRIVILPVSRIFVAIRGCEYTIAVLLAIPKLPIIAVACMQMVALHAEAMRCSRNRRENTHVYSCTCQHTLLLNATCCLYS